MIKKILLTILVLILITILVVAVVNFLRKRQFISAQIKNDITAAQRDEESLKNRPYLKKLPLETQNYFIVYSPSKSQIQVIFKTSSEDIATLKNTYQDEVIKTLKEIGVNTLKEEVIWLKTDKN